MSAIFTAKRIIALMVALVCVYILWDGPHRFSCEFRGTWVLLPMICVRLLPLPLNHWLITTLVHFRSVDHLILLVPILLLTFSAILSIQSLRKNSLPCALLAFALTLIVFSIYHFVQPMGITLVLY